MDQFTRRGFVGALAAGAVGALWMPKARALDRPNIVARWDAQVVGEQLQVTLHVKVRGSEVYAAAPRAIDVRGNLRVRGRRELALRFEPAPEPRLIRTRSGRRVERRILVGEHEVAYDTFSVAIPSRVRGSAQLELDTRIRGALTDYPEPHRALVAALGRLQASVPVQLT